MRREGWYAIGVVTLLLTFGYQNLRIARAERHAAQSSLRADSVTAEADVTHRVTLKRFGDTITVYQRRIVQARQVQDSLDKALKRERIAKAQLGVSIEALIDTLHAPVLSQGDDSVRFARFQRDDPPYHVVAEVAIPRPPAMAALRLGISLDTIPLGVRLSCGQAVDGIRPALATVHGPDWAQVQIVAVTQDPALCRSPALQPAPRKRWPWLVAGVALGIVGWSLVK